ncbi:MAG: ribose-phosphate pyrophosphokinase, partial [Bacteroidota bacterium]
THPVLSGRAYERVEESALTELIVCDTIPLRQQSAKITALPTAELFAKAIHRVYSYKSISTLFIKA